MPTNKECARRKNEANRQINLMADKLTRKAQGKEPRKPKPFDITDTSLPMQRAIYDSHTKEE